jgi:predicted DNA-binding transcriptional regulator YafY
VNRTDRLYALVEELRAAAPGHRSTTWLAERFEVSGRTIERDLAALQQAGVPIYATPGRRGGYAIDAHHTLPPLNFSPSEVTAIATALAVDSSTPFTHAARSALQKILSALGEVDAASAQELAARVRLFDTRPGRPRPPAVVEHAIVGRRVLRLDYVDRTGVPTGRIVEPIGVFGLHPNWYLWAWCRLREAPRSFRLDRIAGAVMLDEVAPDRGIDAAHVEIPELIGRGILGD